MRCRALRHRPALEPIAPLLQAKRDSRLERTSGPGGGISLAGIPAHPGMKLPERLKAGVESLSGVAMDDVRVHRESSGPGRISAVAYAQGGDIHLGPGQDRHLPHEAWHVAQQKQGRVKADGGAAVNAEPALEAEADRMGLAASRGGASPGEAGAPRAALAGAGVIQPKVIAGDTWLKPTDAVSPTLLTFIRKKKRYRLRDDFVANLTAEPVHLLDMSKKYLLGETHGDAATGKWDEATKNWSRVGKMYERFKALPGSERREVGLPADDPQEQSLESRHAYTLIKVLQAHDELNGLGDPWVRGVWTNFEHSGVIRRHLTRAQDALGETVEFAKGEYGAFLAAFEATTGQSKRSRQVGAFAKTFRDVYQPGIESLDGLLETALNAFDTFHFDDSKAAEAKATFEKALDDIAANRAFLTRMARDLIALTSGHYADEAKALGKFLAPTHAGQGSEILNALDPVRERAMAFNIAFAEPPLLVKVGNDHVAKLKQRLGPSVVAIDETESLEDVTKQLPEP